jgi:hypothetical protein
VFLSEAKMAAVKSQDLRFRLGSHHAFGVKAEGLSGGLVILWNNDTVVSLKSFSRTHIEAKVQSALTGERDWRFTGFYGETARARSERRWDLLKYLRREFDIYTMAMRR